MTSGAGLPVARNAPCPCGSGRRYRDCHGALAAPREAPPVEASYRPAGPDWDDVDAATRARLAASMEAALARQSSGDLAGAARLYRDVLAVAPRTHDALHMLAVAQWGLGDLDGAWRLLERALALREPYPGILKNRDTLLLAREHEARLDAERRSEAALPGLLASLGSPAGTLPAPLAPGEPLHLIVGTADPRDEAAWLADRLAEALAPWEPSTWGVDGTALAAPSGRWRPIRAARGEGPDAGVHVHVGLDLVDRMDWLARAAPRRVVAIGVRARAIDWGAGLSALARHGAVPLQPLFVTSAQAARFGAAGPVVPCVEPAVPDVPEGGGRRWTLGVVAGNGWALETVREGPLLRTAAGRGIAVAIRDPGRLRYALGDLASVRFESRAARPLADFVASVDALLVPARRWQDEGLDREIALALRSGRPVIAPASSIHADEVRASPFGRIVAGDDEALEAIATLARSDGAPVAPAREPADARLESARRILGAALALGARRSGDC